MWLLIAVLDALTVSYGTNENNYSSFEKAFEAMTNAAVNYTIKLNENASISKLSPESCCESDYRRK